MPCAVVRRRQVLYQRRINFRDARTRPAAKASIAACVVVLTAGLPHAARAGVAVQRPSVVAKSASADTTLVKLQSDVSELRRDVYVLGTLVIALLGGGFLIGFVTTIRTETKNTEMHHLLYAGESAAQSRAEETHTSFLDASQRTLTLVNETLELAKEASKRAEDAVKLRAEHIRDEVESRARGIVAPLIMRSNPKDIVLDDARLDIVDLARELSAVEGHLELQGMALSPTCLFVKGMDAHFRDDTRAASKSLLLAGEEANNRELSTVALYWAAYELNNLGNFTRALDIFRKARAIETPGGPRWFELQRIILETQFFDIARAHQSTPPQERLAVEEIHELVREVDTTITAMPDTIELQEARRNMIQTLGNIRWWSAGPAPFPTSDVVHGGHRASLVEARDCYANVIRRDDPWALFGKAEADLYLTLQANREDYERIIELAGLRLTKRAERRSRVSLDQTALIAQNRITPGRSELKDTNDRLRETLRDLDSEIWVFSQFRKCNVTWAEFEREVNDFWDAVPKSALRTWEVV